MGGQCQREEAGNCSKVGYLRKKYIGEYETAEWVYTQNITKGLAPSSGQIVNRINRHVFPAASDTDRRQHAPDDWAAAPSETVSRNDRVKAWRWRKRWRVSLCKVRAQDDISAQEITMKAGNMVPFLGPQNGPTS